MSVYEKLALAVSRMISRPRAGRMILPRREDSLRDYPSSGLTPSRLSAILREADEGSLSSAMQLFEEMEEKDPHLYCVANTRRLALTGLEWDIAPAAGAGIDPHIAEETAAHCGEVLRATESFDEVLQHLALATGRNLSVAEIVWEFAGGRMRPVEFAPVDFVRLIFNESGQLRILTEAQPREGVAPPTGKFIVHTPHNVSGHPQRGGLLRVSAMSYLAKNLSLKDWLIYAEIFGMPIRIARYDPLATPEERRELLTMLESLGSNAAGVFSRAVELQVIETGRGTMGPPYERLVDFLNREMSKAWLGQTLTTDISGQKGALSATQVHDQVRQDILADDMRKEARTLRRDLLMPMTRLEFGPTAPVPHFRRRPPRTQESRDLAELLDVAVNRIGLKLPRVWMHEALGLPQETDASAGESGE